MECMQDAASAEVLTGGAGPVTAIMGRGCTMNTTGFAFSSTLRDD